MEEGDASVYLDREVFIGSGEITSFGHPNQFLEEMFLIFTVADMFDDGIGVADVKSVVGEGERAAVGHDGFDLRIALGESIQAFF